MKTIRLAVLAAVFLAAAALLLKSEQKRRRVREAEAVAAALATTCEKDASGMISAAIPNYPAHAWYVISGDYDSPQKDVETVLGPAVAEKLQPRGLSKGLVMHAVMSDGSVIEPVDVGLGGGSPCYQLGLRLPSTALLKNEGARISLGAAADEPRAAARRAPSPPRGPDSSKSDPGVWRESFESEFEGVRSEMTYELAYPASRYRVARTGDAVSIVNRKTGAVCRLRISNEANSGRTPQEYWDAERPCETCEKMLSELKIQGDGTRVFADGQRKWILFQQDAWLFVAKYARVNKEFEEMLSGLKVRVKR
jgi:hypothetical protein